MYNACVLRHTFIFIFVGYTGKVDTLGFLGESFPLPGVPTKFPRSITHFVAGAVNGGEYLNLSSNTHKKVLDQACL